VKKKTVQEGGRTTVEEEEDWMRRSWSLPNSNPNLNPNPRTITDNESDHSNIKQKNQFSSPAKKSIVPIPSSPSLANTVLDGNNTPSVTDTGYNPADSLNKTNSDDTG
jgi:hypothetical protein